MFFVADHRVYFVGFAVDLFQVVFVLLDFSFVVFDGFEVGVDDGSGFDFFLIVHSVFDGFDDGFEFELNDEEWGTNLYF